MLKDLEQDYSLAEGKCSATLEEALQVLTAFEDQHGLNKKCNRLRELRDAENPGLSFAQKIEMTKKQVCFRCKKPGHKAYQCKEKEEATGNKQPAGGVGAAQIIDDNEPKSWMD